MCTVLGIGTGWWAVAGLALDIVGFLIIAFEWRLSMYDDLARLELEQDLLILGSGGTTTGRSEISPRAMKLIQAVSLEKIAGDDKKFDQFIKNILILDTVDRLNRRRSAFLIGFAIVTVGFALQAIGAWPC